MEEYRRKAISDTTVIKLSIRFKDQFPSFKKIGTLKLMVGEDVPFAHPPPQTKK
jgi:hypothetical protein